MRISMGKRLAILGSAAFLGMAATTPWHATISETPRANVVGNPEAETTLTEFVSYTCPHCATFTREGEPALQIGYIGTGKVKLEIRPVIRNIVDVVATMTVQCGDADKFMTNHSTMMARQPQWMEAGSKLSQAQVQRWRSSDKATARRAIASDLGFYDMMEGRGYTRTAIDQCLSDDARAEQLIDNSIADGEQFGHTGTPSFALNGTLMKDVHQWSTLETALNATLLKAPDKD